MIASREPRKGWISAFWISVCLLRTPPCEAVRGFFFCHVFILREKPLSIRMILEGCNLFLLYLGRAEEQSLVFAVFPWCLTGSRHREDE